MTKNKPKPLLEVKGKPIIEHIISHFDEIPEIDGIFVVTNEKFSLNFEQWAKELGYKTSIKVINDLTTSNDDRKGAVGDMKFAIDEAEIDEDLLVIAGDNLFEYKLTDFYSFFKEKNSSVVAARDLGSKDEVKEKFGVIEIDAENKITGFEEKPKQPKTSLAATACYIFRKEDIKEINIYIEEDNPPDNAGDFVKWLSNHKNVYCFVFTENWFDIGSFESLGKAREEFNG